jgi:hypothetical protein
MIIVKLAGGLGNQMFQYAFGRCLAHRQGFELKFDRSEFNIEQAGKKGHVFREYDLGILNIQENFATKEEVFKLGKRFENDLLDRACNRIFGRKKSYLLEPHFHFSPTAYNAPDNVYLVGYWQTEKYFKAIEPLIRTEFTFKEEMSEKAKEMLGRINNSNSICLNVRRGDFVTNNFHGSHGAAYFGEADAVIKQKIADYTYYVFSDEIEWCEENLKFDNPTVFVSHEFAGKKFQDYIRLMAACKHFVIPNSSFAWWAVWLNQDKDKIVIAPKIWFTDSSFNTNDLIPAGWIRI